MCNYGEAPEVARVRIQEKECISVATKAKNMATMNSEELAQRLAEIDAERKEIAKAARRAKNKEKREALRREAEAEAKRIAEEKDALYEWSKTAKRIKRYPDGSTREFTVFVWFTSERNTSPEQSESQQ